MVQGRLPAALASSEASQTAGWATNDLVATRCPVQGGQGYLFQVCGTGLGNGDLVPVTVVLFPLLYLV